MRKRSFAVYDVFSSERLAGNPLAVVFDADGLDDAAMQAIAGEFNLSETVFILPPFKEGHRACVRIFTPMHELPFAGHPTVGAAIAIVEAAGGEDASIFVLEEKVGPVRCAVSSGRTACSPNSTCRGCPSRWRFRPIRPRWRHRSTSMRTRSASRTMSCRPIPAAFPTYLVPVAGFAAAARADLDTRAWTALTGPAEALSPAAFVYCRETTGAGNAFHARMFAGHLGIPEDPATGSAVASFAGAIMRFDAPIDGVNRYAIEQGVEMGRPSLIQLELDVRQGALAGARIGGNAIKVSEGKLLL